MKLQTTAVSDKSTTNWIQKLRKSKLLSIDKEHIPTLEDIFESVLADENTDSKLNLRKA